MPNRYYVPPATDSTDVAVGAEFILDSEQAHYVLRVMRRRNGDEIDCFNGTGTTFSAEVVAPQPKQCTLRVLDSRYQPQVSWTPIVALALLKGAAMDRAIAQSVESGAGRIVLFRGERSNVSLDARRSENKLAHWKKTIISACEQCGQVYLPELALVDSLEDMINVCASVNTELLVLDMDAPLISLQQGVTPAVLVGPEGGWSPQELDYLQQTQARMVSIGPLTLRAETVPAAALSLINFLNADEKASGR